MKIDLIQTNFEDHKETIQIWMQTSHIVKFYEQLERKMGTYVLFKAVNESKITMGYVCLFEINMIQQTACIDFCFAPDYLSQADVVEALKSAMAYAFHSLQLNKVYTKCLNHEEQIRTLYLNMSFIYEGRLRSHYIWKGRSYNLHLSSIMKDEFDRIYSVG